MTRMANLMHGKPSVLDRRQLLQWAGRGALIAGMTPQLSRNAFGQVSMPVIDAHCHVFNASDLPVRNFIRRVVFEDYEEASPAALAIPRPFAGLIATLISFLSTGVITATAELELIEGGFGALASEFDPYSRDTQRILQNVLDQLLSGERPDALSAGLTADEQAEFRAQIEAEMRTGDSGPSALGGPLALSLLGSSGLIGRHLRWAALLRSPRLTIAREINALYGGNGRVGLFAPALVDYTAWLDEVPRSDIASQIKVMEAVQRKVIHDHGFLLHCMAPFDPWHQALDVEHGNSPTALDSVREAVEQRGFLGVKLYPPMGFLPAGNAGAGRDYPDRHHQLAGFATKIDAALEALYAWAEANGVAVLAHAAESNGAGKGFASRANPAGWRAVLERHPGLSISLAHLGDFDSQTGGQSWEFETGELLADFDNVFADLSYMSNALLPGGARRNAAAAKLGAYFNRYDPQATRALYGSDWIMLGREADYQRYLEATQSFLVQAGIIGSRLENIRSANAVRFYGLASGAKARTRLETWYGARGLDVRLLDRFG